MLRFLLIILPLFTGSGDLFDIRRDAIIGFGESAIMISTVHNGTRQIVLIEIDHPAVEFGRRTFTVGSIYKITRPVTTPQGSQPDIRIERTPLLFENTYSGIPQVNPTQRNHSIAVNSHSWVPLSDPWTEFMNQRDVAERVRTVFPEMSFTERRHGNRHRQQNNQEASQALNYLEMFHCAMMSLMASICIMLLFWWIVHLE